MDWFRDDVLPPDDPLLVEFYKPIRDADGNFIGAAAFLNENPSDGFEDSYDEDIDPFADLELLPEGERGVDVFDFLEGREDQEDQEDQEDLEARTPLPPSAEEQMGQLRTDMQGMLDEDAFDKPSVYGRMHETPEGRQEVLSAYGNPKSLDEISHEELLADFKSLTDDAEDNDHEFYDEDTDTIEILEMPDLDEEGGEAIEGLDQGEDGRRNPESIDEDWDAFDRAFRVPVNDSTGDEMPDDATWDDQESLEVASDYEWDDDFDDEIYDVLIDASGDLDRRIAQDEAEYKAEPVPEHFRDDDDDFMA